MYGKIIRNDIRKSKLISITITAFILAAATLTSLAAALIISLFGAIDNMLLLAKAPHFMQMHTGELDPAQISQFAATEGNVEAYQLSEFLNVEGSQISIGQGSLLESVQDNGFSVQSESFDFLLDLNGNVIQPGDGEVYVPLGYMKDGSAKLGDTLSVGDVSLTVAGFLRDSQMNSDLAGSKRFLVSQNDFARLQAYGSMEYLIEFRLQDPAAFTAFQSAYFEAGLPSNGPPVITEGIIRLANALSDGIMIAVLVLISILVVIVAILCIRFTLLAKIEEDYREIGVLKAVGLRVADISKLYTAKYGAIAGIASLLGWLLSLPLRVPLTENIRLYMGESGKEFTATLIGLAGAAVIFLIIMLYIKAVLRRFRKISAAQAVRFGAPQEKSKPAKGFQLSRSKLFGENAFLGVKDVLSRSKLYITMLLVLIISSFILIVPQNLNNTISARSFMSYMGIGECDMLIYLMQTQAEDIPQKTAEIDAALAADERVAKYGILTGMVFNMPMEGGAIERLRVDLGDHTAFPVTYAEGGAPVADTEIALSTLYADELEKSLGDEITLIVDGVDKRLTVCGIYSDVTNGGKTAKATFTANHADLLRIGVSVELREGVPEAETVDRYEKQFPFATVGGADAYIGQTMGSTVSAIRLVSYAAILAAAFLTILITLLFMKMLVAKDRYTIAVYKSLGFPSAAIRRQYMVRAAVVLVIGVLVGVLLANTVGELVGVAMISSFGASAFHFVIDPLYAYLFAPLLIAACVLVATVLGVSDIRPLKISDHIKEA